MQALNGPVHLVRQVDVPLSGAVALVPHQRLQGVRCHRLRVDRGEGPAKVMKPIAVAGRRVLVLLVAGETNARHFLNPCEISPKGPLVVWPRENHRIVNRGVDDLPKMLDYDRMERNQLVSVPFVVFVASDGCSVTQRHIFPPQGQRFRHPPSRPDASSGRQPSHPQCSSFVAGSWTIVLLVSMLTQSSEVSASD